MLCNGDFEYMSLTQATFNSSIIESRISDFDVYPGYYLQDGVTDKAVASFGFRIDPI